MSDQAIAIGAGISGAVMAEKMATKPGWEAVVLEQREHLGGNCYDYLDEDGVLIHKYGPHLFHSDKQRVCDYSSQFTDRGRAVPLHGYSAIIRNMLSHPGIELRLSSPMHTRVQLDWSGRQILLDEQLFEGLLIYGGMIDQLLPDSSVLLPYQSLRFEHKHLKQEWFQIVTTINYPNGHAHPPITEFKHLTGLHQTWDSITYEYPCDYNLQQVEPYYPIFTEFAQQQHHQCVAQLHHLQEPVLRKDVQL